MSKKDVDDLLQFTIRADGEYQKRLIECINLKNDEIERLEKELAFRNKQVFYDFKEIKKRQERIDKAIEYIEKNDDEWFSTVELIGILKGEEE